MKMKLTIDDNTVSSENQVSETDRFKPYLVAGATKKIAIVGNSITLHNPLPSIGWSGAWGMAASCAENDFCHIIMREVREKYPDTSFAIVQGADWERNFWEQPENYNDQFRRLEAFDPDIIVFRLGENSSRELCAEHDFAKGFMTLCDHFSNGGKRKLLITETFWASPWTEKGLTDAANKYCDSIIPLSDLGEKDEMKALGLFSHYGVSIHPGDLGMKAIAERILEKLYKTI